MKSCLWLLVLASAALISGCGSPSIHPLASNDTKATDPALVGTWAQADAKDDTTYTVAASGDHYALTVNDRDPKKPETWEFELRLVQLGKRRFVDVQTTEADRKTLDERWSSLVIPTHLFGRYAVEGDTLRFWALNEKWFRTSVADGRLKLAHTSIDHDWTLITAETPDLQAFLKAHAEDAGAFDLTELKRVKP